MLAKYTFQLKFATTNVDQKVAFKKNTPIEFSENMAFQPKPPIQIIVLFPERRERLSSAVGHWVSQVLWSPVHTIYSRKQEVCLRPRAGHTVRVHRYHYESVS